MLLVHDKMKLITSSLVKAFISAALSRISEVVWPSHSATWRVIEIGVESVVSMATAPYLKGGILC